MKLRNNFTTPEQSKRLLELGLPIDSADCFYNQEKTNIHVVEQEITQSKSRNRYFMQWGLENGYTPCWSVGRLLEIYIACAKENINDPMGAYSGVFNPIYLNHPYLIDNLISDMCVNKDILDFSELK